MIDKQTGIFCYLIIIIIIEKFLKIIYIYIYIFFEVFKLSISFFKYDVYTIS